MSGEYWKKIQAQKSLREAGEEAKKQAELRKSNEPVAQADFGQRALDTVQAIFEEIRVNAPEVRREPHSRVRRDFKSVILEWGTKLGLTSQEEALVKKFYDEYYDKGRERPSYMPEKILEFDGYQITAELYHSHDVHEGITLPGSNIAWQTSRFVENPDSFIPQIEKAFSAIANGSRRTEYIRLSGAREISPIGRPPAEPY